jgi:hypothetical protein
MSRKSALSLITLIAGWVTLGCGSGVDKVDKNPSTPPQIPEGLSASDSRLGVVSNRHIWGLWEINISADPPRRVEIVPARMGQMHLNVVRLLEVTPCKNCLTIENVHPAGPNELEADVRLQHPFPGLLKYTGFDVRGIFIAQTDFTFPVSGRKIAWGDGVPRMLNPDGYTQLFNPTEYPPTTPAALGYIEGKYSTGGDLTATLNPFLAYRRDAPRRMFEAGGSETRTVSLYAPPGPIHFGYAVDACWQLVPHEVIDPLVDFPPDANCLEAYSISVDFPYDLNSSWMSQNPVSVEVFDHQGLATISAVTIEAPELFSGETALTYSTQTGEESWLFSGMVTNETGAVEETYPFLVKVTDMESDQNLGSIDAWQLSVVKIRRGWARTWGGSAYDWGYSVAIDGSGNAYITGFFWGTVDFDPGPGVDSHTSNGGFDVFLSKLDPSGNYLWALTWGGSDFDWGYSVAIDGSGNAYITGAFQGTVDFDPGPAVDNHTSNGDCDVFLSKLDPNGNYLWARIWGESSWDEGYSVAIDGSGNAYITGYLTGTADFDPGPGVDNHTSNGGSDVFLSKLDQNGNYLWARTWGGPYYDSGWSVAIDGSGNAYITGLYTDTVDFDSGPGVEFHTSNGDHDVFLSKLDPNGNYLWARTWGGSYDDRGYSVTIDATGNAYITGYFYGIVDFDPGPGVDNHTSNSDRDVFLSKLDPNGNYLWARTWGGSTSDRGYSVAIDGSGNAYITGDFYGTVDFDPGPGVDNHKSNADWDIFLSKLDPNGNYLWARTWGGPGPQCAYSVAIDGSGNAYVTGYFYGTVDFDPGAGVDNHTPNGGVDVFLSKFPPGGNW